MGYFTAVTKSENSRAGRLFDKLALAEQDANNKNAKAQEMGIESRYVVDLNHVPQNDRDRVHSKL